MKITILVGCCLPESNSGFSATDCRMYHR